MVHTPQQASRDAIITRLLKGAVDIHCHSGPSIMPRCIDHLEAMEEASAAGLKAVLVKDHYYSATPITLLLNKRFGHLGVEALSGVPLNNALGGFNPHAVDHGIKLGARIIWMPTNTSANHIHHHHHDQNFDQKFPQTVQKMLEPEPLTVLGPDGKLIDKVLAILDMIAAYDLVLSAGHLHITEIFPLLEEAKARGVRRMMVNHPTYVIDATVEQVGQLARMGAYIEHSVCMWADGSKFKFYEPALLRALIDAAGIDRTILGSDLGQVGNPRPVEGFRNVINQCLDMGLEETDIRKMISDNPCRLLAIA